MVGMSVHWSLELPYTPTMSIQVLLLFKYFSDVLYLMLTMNQCDQIGYFKKDLGCKFFTKVAKSLGNILCNFEKVLANQKLFGLLFGKIELLFIGTFGHYADKFRSPTESLFLFVFSYPSHHSIWRIFSR